MAVHVTCPQCKKQVPFGRLFCTFCGTKLDLSANTVTNRLTAKEAMSGVRKVVIRLVVLAIVFGAIAVFFWPARPGGRVGSESHAKLVEQKEARIRSQALNGILFAETFTDEEVNAWLRERVGKLEDKGSGAGFQLADVNVAFQPGVIVVNTRLEMSKLAITYEITGRPSVSSSGFKYDLTGLRIGHVPIPPFAHDFFAGRALNVFSGMSGERDLINRMRKIEVEPGLVRISNQNR